MGIESHEDGRFIWLECQSGGAGPPIAFTSLRACGFTGHEDDAELANGTVDGLANLAADAVSLDLLHVPAGLARLLGSAWQGGGGASGLAALFWEPGRAQVAAAEQAADGDFRGGCRVDGQAVSVEVATGLV
jgi:hypothetical protein